ncbi:MAG TPA: DPP IV N-terminal domain-containing protein [Candidatus Limnocylindrales bacterium]|nr:DPP IV N-terminal domain-containing protein [Candidatus Limnocylindrales bacterium]
MQFRRLSQKAIPLILLVCAIATQPLAVGQQKPSPSSHPGELTVERIYSQSSLSGRLTSGIGWSPDGKQLTFLETKGSGKDAKTELWAMDLASGQRSLLISADKLETVLPAPSDKPSQATGAGRRGPPQYQWAPGSGAMLFEGPSSLAWYDLKTQTARVLLSGRERLSDVKISPDGEFVSFLRDHNIWLVGVADGKERALTSGGTEEIRKGELDWVYPEELEIFSAYWWAPDSSAIAYLEMDERNVTQFPLVDFESFAGAAEMQRYPVAGGKNPVVRVLVAPLNGGQPRAMDIGADTDIYIPRVNWLPDSRHLAIQLLNREQTILELLVADTSTGKTSTLLTEKDSYWVNVHDDLHFFKDGKRFLWSSERSGFRHLYLYGLDGKQQAQLTHGDWEVSQVKAVDEANGIVYFTATEKSTLEHHLYRVSLDGRGFARLTKEDGTHDPQFSPNQSFYLDTYSNAATPPRQDLYRAEGTHAAILNENKAEELAQYHLSPVEFFTVKSRDGVSLNSYTIKPPRFDPAKKYPVIVYTYGGPHAQVVRNAWGGPNFLWHQMMAQKGYVIFVLDNRGSSGRGHAFETPIYHRLGAQELSDQRDGVAWLREQPWVDTNRIGIWGWSYGGHMTLHAMFEAGDLFKVGFAGGPVTDWHYYDSIYTERYMGLPDKNPAGYKECSPLDHAAGLKGKLLIVHGTGDDNVHYSNTLAVVNDLIRDGKYVEVIAAPGRGHGVSDPPARKIVWARVAQFFLDNL